MDILAVFSSRAWQHLIVALLHTLWQGAILASLMTIALRRIPARRHDARYWLALAAQFGVLLAGLVTWSILEYQSARPPVVAGPTGRIEPRVPAGAAPSVTIAAEAAPVPSVDGGAPRWVAIVAIAWLAGVGLMLVRTAGSVWSASRLARGPRVAEPAVLAMIGRIREELGIGRPIRVVEALEAHGPAVLGVLWPTLLLPASVMTGLPPESLRAILIHELAHIRRYDYLVNIAQMLVESVLFFNPTVWWIGRQVRLEREACCDATAVRLTGRPLDYSRSLAEWAGRSRGVVVAAAWAGDRRPGTLLERVRRVLRPGDRPAARVSPSGLLLLLLGGPLLLVLLWHGTSVAVQLAARVLSPSERIQRLEAARDEYDPPIVNPDAKGTLKGTIRTADGKPPARPIMLDHKTVRVSRGNTIMGSLAQVGGEFSVEVPTGTTWLAVNPEDYAPAVVGPFDVRLGRTIDGIRIVLEAGFSAKIAVADGRGVRVPGARVSAYMIIDDNGSVGTTNGWIADRDGVATIPHAVAKPYHISVAAPGYEPLTSARVTPSAEEARVVTLTRAVPSRGVAVDPQGKPVAGAEVRVFLEEKDRSISSHHIGGPLLATTDADGRFFLDTLKGGTRYILFVTSKAGGRGISPTVRAGQDGIRVTVGPPLTINGTIKAGGDGSGKSPMPATVDVSSLVPVNLEHDQVFPVTTRISVDRQGHFTATKLLPCETAIDVAGRTVKVNLDRPDTEVTIDLSRPASQTPMRRVVLRVATPDGGVPSSGSLYVFAPLLNDPVVPLDKGRAAFDAPVSTRVSYSLRSMVGYWCKGGDAEIGPGDGEQVIDIPAVPAGAIAGQVVDADGKPVTGGVDVRCATVEAVPGLQPEMTSTNNLHVDAWGRFFVSPLPLGGAYAVIAARGHSPQVSPAVRLDGSKPTERITIKLARTAAAEVRVVAPDGRPLTGLPVELELVHPIARSRWSPATRTDGDGRLRFDDLSPELDGYRAIVVVPRGYQAADARLRPGGPPVEIRLERGHVIEGRVVDAATGRPIPGIAVFVQRPVWKQGEPTYFDAEAKTDDQGRFRFSNLPDGSWQLSDHNGLDWESPHKTHLFGVDGPEPIEIRATRPIESPRPGPLPKAAARSR